MSIYSNCRKLIIVIAKIIQNKATKYMEELLLWDYILLSYLLETKYSLDTLLFYTFFLWTV